MPIEILKEVTEDNQPPASGLQIVGEVDSPDVAPISSGVMPEVTTEPQVGTFDRIFTNIFFGSAPTLQAKYLQGKGYTPYSDPESGETLWGKPGSTKHGPIEESGWVPDVWDIVEGADDVLKAVISPARGGLGKLTTLGALADAGVSMPLAYLGSKASGIDADLSDFAITGMVSGAEGGLGGVINKGLGIGMDAVLRSPDIAKNMFVRSLNKILGVPDKQVADTALQPIEKTPIGDALNEGVKTALGKEAAPEAVGAVVRVADDMPPALPVRADDPETSYYVPDNSLEKVVDYVHERLNLFKKYVNSPQPISAVREELKTLAPNIGKAKQQTVEALTEKGVGVPSEQAQNILQDTVNQFKTQERFASLVKDGAGEPRLVNNSPEATQVDNIVTGLLDEFKAGRIDPEVNARLQTIDRTLESYGGEGKFKIGDVEEFSTSQLEKKLAAAEKGKDKNLVSDLKEKLARRKNEVNDLIAEQAELEAKKGDKFFTFADLDALKGLVRSKLDNLGGMSSKRLEAQVYHRISGALGKFNAEVAEQGDQVLGPTYRDLVDQYGTLQDGIAYLTKGASEEAKDGAFKEGSNKILRTLSGVTAPVPYAAVKMNQYGPGFFGGVREKVFGSETATDIFRTGIDNLPPSLSANSLWRDPNTENMKVLANELMNKAKVKPLMSYQMSRWALNEVGVADAGATNVAPPLKQIRNSIALDILAKKGIITPEQRESGVDAATIPEEIMAEVDMMTNQVMEPLESALQFGNEQEAGIATANLYKMYSDMLPPPKTGMKGEVQLSNGTIKLYDPADRAAYSEKVHKHNKLPWNEKAKIISGLNRDYEAKPLK